MLTDPDDDGQSDSQRCKSEPTLSAVSRAAAATSVAPHHTMLRATARNPAGEATASLYEFSRTTRFPEFLNSDPTLWIARVESYFEFAGVTDQRTMFHRTTSAIGEPMVYDLRDLINNIPAVDPYDHLGDALLQRFSASESLWLRRLVGESLDDRTPSQFLRHLLRLDSTNANTPASFIRNRLMNYIDRPTSTSRTRQRYCSLVQTSDIFTK